MKQTRKLPKGVKVFRTHLHYKCNCKCVYYTVNATVNACKCACIYTIICFSGSGLSSSKVFLLRKTNYEDVQRNLHITTTKFYDHLALATTIYHTNVALYHKIQLCFMSTSYLQPKLQPKGFPCRKYKTS